MVDGDLEDRSIIMGEVGEIQAWPRVQLQGQLEAFFVALRDANEVLEGRIVKNQLAKEIKHHMTVYSYHKNTDYEKMLERRRRIEVYKKNSETQRMKQMQLEQEAQNKKEEEHRLEEQKRLEQENLDFARLRKEAEKEDLKKWMIHDKFEKLKSSKIGQLVIAAFGQDKIENLNLNPEKLIQEQVKQMEKEWKKQQQKLLLQEKKWDYLVRALHLAEIPMRDQEYDVWKVEDRDYWEKFQEAKIKAAEDEHQHRSVDRIRT